MIFTRNTTLDSPVKNNAFQLFKITKRRKALQPKVPLLKASISLFGQLYIATTERRGDNCDLDTFFAHEAHSFPPSLANGNEKMYHSTKSDIIHCIEKEAEAVSHMVQRRQTPSSSTIAWFKTAANVFTSWMLEEREHSSSSHRDYS